jgi:hypothetical protein
MPMRRTCPAVCARAASGHAAAAPPSSVMNSRRSFDHLVGTADLCTAITVSLFDDPVGEREQLIRHVKAKCLRGLEIDYELELGRLQDR